MKEQTGEALPYLPISKQAIIESLNDDTERQLNEFGVSGGLIAMIRMGYTTRLREDVYDLLSDVLKVDISRGISGTPDMPHT